MNRRRLLSVVAGLFPVAAIRRLFSRPQPKYKWLEIHYDASGRYRLEWEEQEDGAAKLCSIQSEKSSVPWQQRGQWLNEFARSYRGKVPVVCYVDQHFQVDWAHGTEQQYDHVRERMVRDVAWCKFLKRRLPAFDEQPRN